MEMSLFLFVFVIGSTLVLGYDIQLTSSPDTVVKGEAVTLICKVNSSLKLTSVIWSRNETNIFSTSIYSMDIITSNYAQFKPIAGRFFTTMRGAFEHHVILTTNQDLDHGVSWRCGNSLFQSNDLVMSVVSPVSTTSYCYDSAGCMLGISAGVILAVLVIIFLFALCKGQVRCLPYAVKRPERHRPMIMKTEEVAYVNIEFDKKDLPTETVHRL